MFFPFNDIDTITINTYSESGSRVSVLNNLKSPAICFVEYSGDRIGSWFELYNQDMYNDGDVDGMLIATNRAIEAGGAAPSLGTAGGYVCPQGSDLFYRGYDRSSGRQNVKIYILYLPPL